MGRSRLLWIAAVLVFGGAAPAAAASDTVEVSPVLVTPRRVPGLATDASEFPGNATVLTAEEIEASGATSLPELLGRVEGVTVMDTHGFGLGADGSVNLRGVVNSARTGALVLLDGARLNRVTGDEVHWQSLPLAAIERIEILRGGGGVIYGEGALAGVISITTKRAAERPVQLETTTEVGSYGQQRHAVATRGRQGPIRYGATYERRLLTGYRENTQSRTTNLLTHAGVEILPALQTEVRVLHSEDTSEFAGGITPVQSQARRNQAGSFPGFFDDETTQVSWTTRWAGPFGLSLASTKFWHLRESDSVTTLGRFATIAPSRGLSLQAGHEAARGELEHTLVAGLDLLDEKASTGTRGSKLAETNKHSYGLFVEETVRLWDRVSLTAGGRFDRSRIDADLSFPAFEGLLRFDGWSPKAAVSVDVLEPLTVYASFARPFKAPNVDDFSATVQGPFVFASNVTLEPQQANDFELGARWDDERLGSAEAAWFYTRFYNEILFNDLPGNDQNQNFNTRRTGVELSTSPRLPWEAVTGTVTYTFLDAEFRRGPFLGQTLPGVPEHRLTTHLAWEPVPGLIGTLDWRLVQDFFRINDFNNVFRGDNYGVLDLGLRFVYEDHTVYFRIENVTNEEYTTFQSSNGVSVSTGENPAPSTTWLAGVTFTF